jgi:hypothetical protein
LPRPATIARFLCTIRVVSPHLVHKKPIIPDGMAVPSGASLGNRGGGMRLGRLIGMKEQGPILLQYVVPAVLGLVAGVVGSLVAPWVQWAVETRRNRQNYRRELRGCANRERV